MDTYPAFPPVHSFATLINPFCAIPLMILITQRRMADTNAFRKRLSHHTAVTLEDLSLATHYMKFAFAAYGYKLYVVAMFGVVGRSVAHQLMLTSSKPVLMC